MLSGEGLTSFNKDNSANFFGEKKKKNSKAFWGDYFLKLCEKTSSSNLKLSNVFHKHVFLPFLPPFIHFLEPTFFLFRSHLCSPFPLLSLPPNSPQVSWNRPHVHEVTKPTASTLSRNIQEDYNWLRWVVQTLLPAVPRYRPQMHEVTKPSSCAFTA